MSFFNLYRRLVPYRLRFRIAGIRGALQTPIASEIFTKSISKWHADGAEELLSNMPLSPSSIAIDVGAYRGNWCSDIFARYRCRVIAVEPVAAFAVAIEKRFRYTPEIEIARIGLGASSRTESVSILGDASSALRPGDNQEVITIVDVDTWLLDLRVKKIDLLQINCEGGEYEIVPRLAETGWLARIDHLLVQFHLVGPSPESARQEIRRRLSETHEEVFCYPFVWEYWRLKSKFRHVFEN